MFKDLNTNSVKYNAQKPVVTSVLDTKLPGTF